jgi:hypothetical protein
MTPTCKRRLDNAAKSAAMKVKAAAPWKLDRIIPYPGNPRTHPPEQIEILAQLLLKYGADQPIVVDESGVVLKGHGRLEAAGVAGLKTFPVVVRTGMSGADKTAMRLSDNQVALLSGWDQGLLRDAMVALTEQGYDMPLLGFSEVQLQSYNLSVEPLDSLPELASGGEPEFSQMTFVLHRSEVPRVLKALKEAQTKISKAGENKNKNGLALALICKDYMRGK